jgi:NADH:ubiquinone oxidoreductase subunit 3 (subunit A)
VISALAVVLAVVAFAVTLQLAIVAIGRARHPFASTASQRVPVIGGYPPETHAWSRFHARYYPMTLVFLPFEMEMMFMYPWAVVFVEEGGKALAEMGMFLLILSVGIVYAYKERVFSWQ